MAALDTMSVAGGDLEPAFLKQAGADFAPTPERPARIAAVAEHIAAFLRRAHSTLDIAICGFRLDADGTDIRGLAAAHSSARRS